MDFSKLEKYLDSLVSSTGGIDTQIKVLRDGQELYSYVGGFRDQAHKHPASEDDCFYFYSLTKPITCTAAMRLVERGLLDLDAPVYKYLPYFKNATVKTENGTRPLNEELLVRHLFSMQSGLNYDLSDAYNEAVKRGADTAELMKVTIESIPLSFVPGTHWLYACRNHDALGLIIEKITGIPFAQYLKENILSPLSMEHIGFHFDDFLENNIADIYRRDSGEEFIKQPTGPRLGPTRNYISGAYGLMGNLSTYIKFAAMLASGGRAPDGTVILGTDALNLMRTDCLKDEFRDEFRLAPFGFGYGLGVRTLITKEFGVRSPIGEFGWDGAAGAFMLADTENNIAVVFLTHTLSGNTLLDQNAIRDLVYEAIFG